MLCAALLQLHPAPETVLAKIRAMALPGVEVALEERSSCGVAGAHYRVTVDGAEEEDVPPAEPGHHHVHLSDVEGILRGSGLDAAAIEDAVAVYRLLAGAESAVHGRPIEQLHFHEVGTLDAVADVVGCSLLMELIAPEKVIASPVHVGAGHVHCAHGILPVPAPATAFILRGVPVYGGEIPVELCTPTGAALLKHFVSGFRDMPPMSVTSVGYGMGRKDLPRLNCVRALLGETADDKDSERVFELVCDIDDMTPERIAFAMEELLTKGALDVTTQSVGMKKSRPGTRLTVLCKEDNRAELIKLIFRHTTTIGVRERECRRYVLDRRTDYVGTEFGAVRVKEAQGFGVAKCKYEYEDLAAIARERELALDEVAEMIDKGII
jgi:uncharacterized protein (TIGR00299 family) protein